MSGYLKYDNRLVERARDMRKNPTRAEEFIWDKILSKKQFFGYKFTRQKMLNYFIVDFYCSKLKLVIEIDGEIHDGRKEYDQERTFELNKMGLEIIRYSNNEVLNNIDFVYNDLKTRLNQ